MNNRYFSTVKQKVLLIVEIIKKKKQKPAIQIQTVLLAQIFLVKF